MAVPADDERPSTEEVRRRIEVALDNQGVENAAYLATIAMSAVQPIIDSLRSQRAAAKIGADFYFTVTGYVRSHPPSDLRSSLIAALQDLEPWNEEWVRLTHEHA